MSRVLPSNPCVSKKKNPSQTLDLDHDVPFDWTVETLGSLKKSHPLEKEKDLLPKKPKQPTFWGSTCEFLGGVLSSKLT